MRIVFMGSAELACPCLDRLLASPPNEVVGVVTQPDRPKGRSRKVSPCPVREHLVGRNIPVLTPEKINRPESVDAIRALAPDVIVVVAYGQLLRPAVLSLPPKCCVNVHASLLPKYRGAAPIQWVIARGESVTGVTTMWMNEAMDAGDIIFQREEPIRSDDTAGTLQDRLALVGADLLVHTLDAVRQGHAPRKPQDPALSTDAPKLTKEHGRIDWTKSAVELHNRVRAFNPWPGCYCEIPSGSGVMVRVLQTRVEQSGSSVPGVVLDVKSDGLLVQTGHDSLRLLMLQPEGRKPMSGNAFLCGHPLNPAAHLG